MLIYTGGGKKTNINVVYQFSVKLQKKFPININVFSGSMLNMRNGFYDQYKLRLRMILRRQDHPVPYGYDVLVGG